ncbi:MAG: M23 family metallopeptidase [Rhodocyclaceae bacterium]|nr:M23 family metallopeptidase [Rhodocyclaceae bacterium]MBX3671136.1 M23 family metallopeptidase [Rhodocyclaceae bacterium]
MQIILVSSRLTSARTITITGLHVVLALVALALLVVATSTLFSWVTLRHGLELRLPFVESLVSSVRAEEHAKSEGLLRENLKAITSRLGQLQAQMLQLDFLGARLGQKVGIQPQDVKPGTDAGKGGPLVPVPVSLSPLQMQMELDRLASQIEVRGDYLGLIDAELLGRKLKKDLLPTTLPVVGGTWNSSSYGVRVDPITHRAAMHEGVDFVGDTGTTIVAAAAGVVVSAEWHAQYGNLIEIDHGKGLTTRYAHASRMFVVAGSFVRRGQKIAEIGSTGRSTGPHLHFEVRQDGVALNPTRFLETADLNILQARR